MRLPAERTRRALLLAGALAAGAGGLAACEADTVTLAYLPEVGDEHRYRYEVEIELTRTLDGGEPTTDRQEAVVTTVEEVVETTSGAVRLRVTVRHGSSAPRELIVAVDQAGSPIAIEQVAGLDPDTVGLGGAALLLAGVSTPPPEEPIALGDTWRFDAEGVADRRLTGEARLRRFGVVDGVDVAVVEADLEQAVDEDVPAGPTSARLTGTLRTETTTTYDLEDGSIRRATARSRGALDALIAAPAGSAAAPVPATIAYDVRVTTTRLG